MSDERCKFSFSNILSLESMRFNLVAILHKSSFSLLIAGKNNQFEEIKVDFPESVVSKSDIFDVDKFSFALKTELIKRPDIAGSEVLFLIPDEKIFTKIVELNKTTVEEEKTRLFTQIPFTEEETKLTILPFGNFVQFTSVPKKLVNDIELSLAKIGFKSVFLPLSQVIAFGFGTKKQQLVGFKLQDHFNLVVAKDSHVFFSKEIDLSKVKEEEILTTIKSLPDHGIENIETVTLLQEEKALAHFLEQNGLQVGLVQIADNLYSYLLKIINDYRGEINSFLLGREPKLGQRKIYFPAHKILSLVGIISFLFLLTGAFLFFKDLGSRNSAPVVTNPTPTPTFTPTASRSAQVASPSSSVNQKANLKVKITNGNGLPGDAGRVEKQLNSLGYTQTETDTAVLQNNRQTTYTISSKVTPEMSEEIKKSLDQDYIKVILDSTPPSGVDVDILTGAKK